MWREVRDWVEELACRAGFDTIAGAGRKALMFAVALLTVVAVVLLQRGALDGTAAADAVPGTLTKSALATEAVSPPSKPTSLTVHVVGEVRRPGVYVLAAGARVVDAIDAAGGLLGDADQGAVNLARAVDDGEQIVIPRVGEAPVAGAPGPGTGGGSASGGKVDLNTATPEQLDALPGVGPATATKIIADREANGPFRTVDDLMRVSGIGPAKFESLKDLVTVR